MRVEVVDNLGPPDLKLVGFQLWVHGYQFPDLDDAWDGNWLAVTAHCGGRGGDVWAGGAILETVSLLQFRDGLRELHSTLRGVAELASPEPNLAVRVAPTNPAGQLAVRVEITPEHLTQGHWFEFEADQSYLPPAIAQCETILNRLPIRDASRRLGV
jgi:hypothetical protein